MQLSHASYYVLIKHQKTFIIKCQTGSSYLCWWPHRKLISWTVNTSVCHLNSTTGTDLKIEADQSPSLSAVPLLSLRVFFACMGPTLQSSEMTSCCVTVTQFYKNNPAQHIHLIIKTIPYLQYSLHFSTWTVIIRKTCYKTITQKSELILK